MQFSMLSPSAVTNNAMGGVSNFIILRTKHPLCFETMEISYSNKMVKHFTTELSSMF